MNPDYDITLNSSESSPSDAARNRFLDSLGVGENALRGLDGNKGEASKADEGVVLSSQPDLDEPEASVDLSKGRAISISVNRGAAVNRSLEITVPALPKAEVTTPAGTIADDLDTVINLSCPECSGDLVIKRRHLGVEGACVWCHTPIVAAETARDRQIRVFPILGGIQNAKTENAPALEVQSEAPVESAPAPWKPLEAAVEPSLPAIPEPQTANAVLPEPADDLYGANFGFSPSFESSAPESDGGTKEAETESATATDTPVPMDLEDLYASTGFGAPAEEKVAEPGFGESLANPPRDSASFNPSGFGAFLQSPAPVSHDDAPPAPLGFATPAPWGPPAKFVSEGPVIDAPPALIEEESSTSDWTSAFENHAKTENAVSSPEDTDSQDTLTAPDGFSGFASSFAASFPESEKQDVAERPVEEPSGFAFSNTPSSKVLFGRSEMGGEAFAMPGHGFSTGSSSEPEPKGFDSLFPSALEQEPGSSVFEASHPDEVPATLEPVSGASLFPSMNQGPSIFGEAPFISFQDEPSAPSSTGSAFSDLQPAPNSPVAGPAPSLTSSVTGNTAPATPVITSLPLEAKPKPKVRKGFMVLMVIIVGFASGAALASFVLPVEEYVQTARAYMEKKFNPAGVTQQALPLPLATGSEAPSEITAP